MRQLLLLCSLYWSTSWCSGFTRCVRLRTWGTCKFVRRRAQVLCMWDAMLQMCECETTVYYSHTTLASFLTLRQIVLDVLKFCQCSRNEWLWYKTANLVRSFQSVDFWGHIPEPPRKVWSFLTMAVCSLIFYSHRQYYWYKQHLLNKDYTENVMFHSCLRTFTNGWGASPSYHKIPQNVVLFYLRFSFKVIFPHSGATKWITGLEYGVRHLGTVCCRGMENWSTNWFLGGDTSI